MDLEESLQNLSNDEWQTLCGTTPGRCLNTGYDDDGNEVRCGNACNPSEQLCFDCQLGNEVTFWF